MNILTQLPHQFDRCYLPGELDYSDWKNIEPFFKTLQESNVDSVEALEKWLFDWSELNDVLNEEGSLRYIKMTCNTADKNLEISYFEFLEKIAENIKTANDCLKHKFLDSVSRQSLDPKKYFVFNRSIQNDVELFCEANVSLETEESKLTQGYQKIIGALTVKFEGREQTLQQMKSYLEYPSRSQRKLAWEAVTERRLKEQAHLEKIFEQLLKIREKIAINAGFSSYRDFSFLRLERFDYKPQDCFSFHEGVETYVVPLARKLQQLRAKELNLKQLRPWDLNVDPKNRQPLKPFKNTSSLVNGCIGMVGRVDSRFSSFLEIMQDSKLFNLESRKNKAPGGYQSTLSEARLPFIFMNSVGVDEDLRTLLHESGHALHVFATRQQPLGYYRHAPMEFCEVASMSMELLANKHLNVFYSNEEDLNRSHKKHLEGIVEILPWIAQVDAFQHWIYTNPGHTALERREKWVSLHQRFGGIEIWDGLERALQCQWHRQLHIFELPFYYIEYGIAQLGALQVWFNSKNDLRSAVSDYWSALQLGGSRPLPELFSKAGIKFNFGPETIQPLMQMLEEELDHL